MPDYIVFPDSNVIVHASIVQDPGAGPPAIRRLHGESSELLDRLAKTGIGYVVPTVKAESYGSIERVIEKRMGQKGGSYSQLQKRSHRLYVNTAYASNDRMVEMLSSLMEVRPDPNIMAQYLLRVEQMSADLRNRYEDELSRLGPTSAGGGRQRGLDWAVLPPALWQLGRFMRQYPNSGDQRILAAVAAFGEEIARGGTTVVIASYDTGFFSPYRHPGGASDTVTAEIYRRFRIRCDSPGEVLRMIGGP